MSCRFLISKVYQTPELLDELELPQIIVVPADVGQQVFQELRALGLPGMIVNRDSLVGASALDVSEDCASPRVALPAVSFQSGDEFVSGEIL